MVVGSLNKDIVVKVDEIPKSGQTVMGEGLKSFFGGKGANQAVTIGRLNGDVSMIGKVGNDQNGKDITKNLKDDGVNVEHIRVQDGISTGIALVAVNKSADNAIIIAPEANGKLNTNDIERNIKAIEEAEIILLQLEIPLEVVSYVIEKGYEMGKYIILNPAPAMNLSQYIYEKVNLITPNKSELELISGISINEKSDIQKAVNKLLNKGVREIIVTLGENGAMYFSEDKKLEFSPQKVKPVDTTGAGDCFNGAVAFGLANGYSIEDAIKLAIKASAISVTREGAQSSFPKMDEL